MKTLAPSAKAKRSATYWETYFPEELKLAKKEPYRSFLSILASGDQLSEAEIRQEMRRAGLRISHQKMSIYLKKISIMALVYKIYRGEGADDGYELSNIGRGITKTLQLRAD